MKTGLLIFFFINFCSLLYSYDSEKIELVKNKKINYALASWWLNSDYEDDTSAVQNAILSGAEFVTISDKGSPWEIDPVFLASNQNIFFDRGVIVEAKKGSFLNKGDKLFSAEKKKNISLIGYGATLRMHKYDYIDSPYSASQWRHIISIRDCSDISIKGFKLEQSGGDGIYIGALNSLEDRRYSENIIIEDVHFYDNYRQGISIISCENLLIKNCLIEKTKLHSPAAGIDFEPNYPEERLVNCAVEDCIIRYNRGPGILLYLASFNDTTLPVSITITHNIITQNRRPISIRRIDKGQKGFVALIGNKLFGLRFNGIDKSSTLKVIRK